MRKNILITGEPKSGKSTLLRKVVAEIDNKTGFLTNEILGENGRVGFEIETSTGHKAVLSHIDFGTEIKVGKYSVDVSALDSVVPTVMAFGPDDTLYLDEVGQMQLHSEKFKALVHHYLDAPNACLMTVSKVYQSEFIDELKARKDVVLVEVTPDTREGQEQFVKLFLAKMHKAKGYIAEPDRFSRDEDVITLRSEHGTRTLTRDTNGWTCTCDFYAKHTICSHVLATNELFPN